MLWRLSCSGRGPCDICDSALSKSRHLFPASMSAHVAVDLLLNRLSIQCLVQQASTEYDQEGIFKGVPLDMGMGIDLSSTLHPQQDQGRQAGGVWPPAHGCAAAQAADLESVLQHPLPATFTHLCLVNPAPAPPALDHTCNLL